MAKNTSRKHKPKPVRNKFYSSKEWKVARYKALVASNGRCQCCGSTVADGARLCVDHVKPLSKYPHLALRQSNLQVLCGSCNRGKGSWDETDWRPDDDAKLDREYRAIMGPPWR